MSMKYALPHATEQLLRDGQIVSDSNSQLGSGVPPTTEHRTRSAELIQLGAIQPSTYLVAFGEKSKIKMQAKFSPL